MPLHHVNNMTHSTDSSSLDNDKLHNKRKKKGIINAHSYKHNTTEKTGKVYSLEYADIPKVFFTSHHVGHCCTDVI
jgi:hypothetical protein